jgi:hypothetical protein
LAVRTREPYGAHVSAGNGDAHREIPLTRWRARRSTRG